MSNASSQPKAGPADYLTFGIYRALEAVIRVIPLEVTCVLGMGLGQLGYWLMPKRRAIVIRNLRIAQGDRIPAEKIRPLAAKVFRTSGMNFIASVKTSLLTADELRKRVSVEGAHWLVDLCREKSGCILLLAHMGNWELLTQLSVINPEIKKPASLYRPLDNPLLDKLIKRRRERQGTKLFSRRDSFSLPITHIKNGGILGAIADQSVGKHGISIPFYGKLASMTNLPALLHRKTKAPIVPLSMITTGLGKWQIVIHPPLEISESERKDTYRITARCAKAYEQIMSSSPADVLWMHNYWRGANRTALKIRGSIPRNMTAADLQFTKPFYLLVYTPAMLDQALLAETLRYIRSCRPDLHVTLVGATATADSADQSLPTDPDEPPHLTANHIRQYEESLPTPFDCAIDLCPNRHGSKLFKMAGIRKRFALADDPCPVSRGHELSDDLYRQWLNAFIARISPAPKT